MTKSWIFPSTKRTAAKLLFIFMHSLTVIDSDIASIRAAATASIIFVYL